VSHFAFVNPGGPQGSADLFLAIRERGMEVGVMRGPSWDSLGAIDLARTLDADLVRLGSGQSQCAVLADIEYHDPAYIIAFLTEWRQLRPHRVTGWTLEPLQGGWVTPMLAHVIGTDVIDAYPQTYLGNMSPVAPDLVRCDLIERGIPRGRVEAVYNAADIPTHWDGIAFPFHELP